MFSSIARTWRKLRFRIRREQLCRELQEEIDLHADLNHYRLKAVG